MWPPYEKNNTSSTPAAMEILAQFSPRSVFLSGEYVKCWIQFASTENQGGGPPQVCCWHMLSSVVYRNGMELRYKIVISPFFSAWLGPLSRSSVNVCAVQVPPRRGTIMSALPLDPRRRQGCPRWARRRRRRSRTRSNRSQPPFTRWTGSRARK